MESREEIRKDANHEKLIMLGLEAFPIATGAAMAGISRFAGMPELIALPLVMDAFFGGVPINSPRTFGKYLYSYAKYALGAALPYIDKIYFATQENLPQVYQNLESLVDKF